MQVNAPIGIIGLGLMGTALSESLIDAKETVFLPATGVGVSERSTRR